MDRLARLVGLLGLVLMLSSLAGGGCTDKTRPVHLAIQDVRTVPDSSVVVEGSQFVSFVLQRADGADSIAVRVYTASTFANPDSSYVPLSEIVEFARGDTVEYMSVHLRQNRQADGDRVVNVLIDPSWGFDAFARHCSFHVRILDDDSPPPAGVLTWPLGVGNQWEYVSHFEDSILEWDSPRTDRVIGTVRFRGATFSVLQLGSEYDYNRILLRQDGPILYYAPVVDTVREAHWDLHGWTREPLPWILADFAAGPGPPVVHATRDTMDDGIYSYHHRDDSQFIGWTTCITPAGIFRSVAILSVRHSMSQFPWHPRSETLTRTFYVADSIGVVEERGYYADWISLWGTGKDFNTISWDAKLLAPGATR